MYFRDYMRTYSNKSPVSHSGKFYNNFKLLATKMNKAIMNQERLSKKVFKNTIVYDARSAIGVGSIASLDYVSPWVYSGAEFNAGSQTAREMGLFTNTVDEVY